MQEPGASVSSDIIVGMRHLPSTTGKDGNKDGMGVMYVDEKGRVRTHKTLPSSDSEVVEMYDKYKDRACAVHLRNQTLGTINMDNVHPFKVTSMDNGDPWDIWMMHNGTIREIQVDTKRADSWNFAHYFLRDFLLESPEAVRSPAFQRIIAALIGNSKLVFLSSSGAGDPGYFTIVNSGKGRMLSPGIWVSRTEKISPKKVTHIVPFSKAPVGVPTKEEPPTPQVFPYSTAHPPTPLPSAITIDPPQLISGSTTEISKPMTPVRLGSWVTLPNGLKTYRLDTEPAESDIDMSVLKEMTEQEIAAVVEDSPGIIAKILHRLSKVL